MTIGSIYCLHMCFKVKEGMYQEGGALAKSVVRLLVRICHVIHKSLSTYRHNVANYVVSNPVKLYYLCMYTPITWARAFAVALQIRQI